MSQGIDADRGGRLRLTPHGLRPFAIMMRPVFGLVILVVGALLVDSTLTSPARAGGVTFEVTQAENAIEQGDGTCDGTCTLREAILAANASPGHDTIVFAPEVFTEDDGANIITPNPLPNVDASEGITIDGTGAVVELFGFELETAGNGLTFTSGVGELVNDVVVRDLFISHFTLGIYMCPGMNENECTSSASNILIEDVTVTESYGEGIGIDATGVTSTMLVGVHATDNGGQGASVSSEGNAEGVSILDSTFSGNMAQGAQIRAFNGLVIDALVQGNTFTNNTSGQSLYITSEASEGVEVAENTVTGPGQGIYMSGSGSDFHVHDNSVQPGTQGIVIFGPGGPDFRITDNQVTGGSGDGIVFSVQSPGTGIELAGNVIMEGGSRAGIFLSSVMPPGSPFLVRNNTVSDRGGDAIHVTGAANATITRNETYNNGQLGIDLNPDPDVNPVPGVTLNDPGDADTGPNGLLNFPEIGVDDGQSVIGTACPECTVELFLSDADPSGYGEGKLFLRDAEANGSGDFSVAICSLVLVPGDKVTATSTDPNGMTSEFSLNHTLTEPAGLCATATPSPTPIATPTPTSEPEPTPTPTAVPTATPTPTATGSPPGPAQGDVDCDGDVDSVDALKQLRHVASLDVQQEPECPAIGSVALFGDVDCDEDVDSVDALFVLRHVAGLPVNVPKECPAIGT